MGGNERRKEGRGGGNRYERKGEEEGGRKRERRVKEMSGRESEGERKWRGVSPNLQLLDLSVVKGK